MQALQEKVTTKTIRSENLESIPQVVAQLRRTRLTHGAVINKDRVIMKRSYIYVAAAAMAASLFSCSQLEELEKDQYIPAPGESVRLILNASKGETKSTADTKVYVGQIANGKVRYYWNEDDQIGVIPFLTDTKPNYVTKETQINPSNKNQAQFETYLQAEGYHTSQPNLLIYYPYNSSMLEGTTGNSGEAYARKGLTFRLPQQQEQYGYSRSFVGENSATDKEHPSVWAISNYGLAYDLAGSVQTTTNEGGQTVSNLQGEFQLDHVNTYFQFNVYGTQSVGGKNYADGSWKLSSINLEAGHCEASSDPVTGEPVYTLTDQISLAGTYKFSYEYNADDFRNVGGVNNNDKITLTSVAPVNSVRVNMNNADKAPALGGTTETYVPAFAVINGKDIKANPKGNLNCLKVSVTCFQYDANGNITGSDTRVRFFNISSIVGTDISGNYYTIDFEICDPVESYTDLSVAGNANCYIISAPGNYTFNLDVAGNGKAPYGGFTAGFDPKNLIDGNSLDDINSKYGFDWLWASGLSFDHVTGEEGDVNIVKQIVNSVSITGEKGEVSIGLNDMKENLSGNVVLALYEKNTDGSVKQIIWTWHLWLGNPKTQHYKFPATNYNWNYTNEDWYILDRNIGAESAEFTTPGDPNGARSNGLYYQRGRKEPIIGFQSANGSSDWKTNQLPTYRNTETFGTLAVWKADVAFSNYNTFSQPMSVIKNIPYTTDYVSQPEKDYTFAWNSSSTIAKNENDTNNDSKSMFDPCPVGYRMPTTREWDNMKADKFRYTIGGQDFGVFGYCVWDGLASQLSASSTDERVQTYIQHLATDKYTVNDQYERTYYINANSGTGQEIVTYFPNTGTLNAAGEWHDTYQGSWTNTTPVTKIEHPAGPQLTAKVEPKTTESTTQFSAPKISTDPLWNNGNNKQYYTVSFSSRTTYYYSVGSESSTPTSSFTGNSMSVYPKSGTTSGSNIYLNLSNGQSKTIYLYAKSGNNFSNPTTVTVSLDSRGRRTVSYKNGDAKNVTTTTTTYNLNVEFAGQTGSYSYATSSTGTKTDISGSSFSKDCASLITGSSASRTLYFYYMNASGVISAQTTVALSRLGTSGNYTYTVGTPVIGNAYTETLGGETETYEEVGNMLLWSSGRVGESTNSAGNRKFDQYWFGPAWSTTDGWASKNAYGDWGHTTNNGKNTAPFTESRETHLFGVEIYGLGEYSNNTTHGYALPIRCIREYDNTSTIVVAE